MLVCKAPHASEAQKAAAADLNQREVPCESEIHHTAAAGLKHLQSPCIFETDNTTCSGLKLRCFTWTRCGVQRGWLKQPFLGLFQHHTIARLHYTEYSQGKQENGDPCSPQCSIEMCSAAGRRQVMRWRCCTTPTTNSMI